MDTVQTERTPFEAVTAQTSALQMVRPPRRCVCFLMFSIADSRTEVAGAARPVHALRAIPVAIDQHLPRPLLHPHLCRAGLVHRYDHHLTPLLDRDPIALPHSAPGPQTADG